MEALIAILCIGVLVLTAIFLIKSSFSKNDYNGNSRRNGSVSSNEDIKSKFRQLNRMATQIRI